MPNLKTKIEQYRQLKDEIKSKSRGIVLPEEYDISFYPKLNEKCELDIHIERTGKHIGLTGSVHFPANYLSEVIAKLSHLYKDLKD